MILQPEPWTPPPQIYYALQQRLAQRDDLLNLRQQVRNQLHALVRHPEVIAEVRARMESLFGDLRVSGSRRSKVKSRRLSATILRGPLPRTRLQSIKGVGWVTAAWTLVTTLNLTSCDTVDALTAYAGLALMPRQSGSSVWHRPSIGHTGNGRLRTAFYMATFSAAQHNPVIKTFYTRLREVGKPEKVARCAAARKLLHIAWAVVKKTSRLIQIMRWGKKTA